MYENTKASSYRWVIIFTITIAFTFNDAGIFSLGMLLPDMSKELDLSPSTQGWLGSSSQLAILFLTIPGVIWVSRFRPWRTASICFLTAAGFTFLVARAPTFAVLLIGRMGMGMSFTMMQAPEPLLIQQ